MVLSVRCARREATAITQVIAARGRAAGYPPSSTRGHAGATSWPWLIGLGAASRCSLAAASSYGADPRARTVPTRSRSRTSSASEPGPGRDQITDGASSLVRRVSNSDVEEGLVFKRARRRAPRGEETVVVIEVSSGKPQVTIPSVVGQTARTRSRSHPRRPRRAGRRGELDATRDVSPPSPRPGTVVVEGTQVRINVSKGRNPSRYRTSSDCRTTRPAPSSSAPASA